MKLNLKMIAVAAAMVASTAAQADFVGGSAAPGNGTFGVLAYNTVTSSYYLRDLGYFLNTFLPNNGAPLTGTGETGATFDKTPNSGLTIDKNVTAGFGADAAWSSWLSAQTATDVRWVAFAGDNNGTSTGVNTTREIVSRAVGTTFTTVSIGSISNGATAISQFAFTNGTPSITGVLVANLFTAANGSFINQAGGTTALDGSANLFYFSRNNAGTGSSAAGLAQSFGNSTGLATLSLASNGDFTYTLAGPLPSPVPVPAAAWLFGSGLMAIGGVVRRRKAAAQT